MFLFIPRASTVRANRTIETKYIKIEKIPEVPEILKKIAQCESGGNQFNPDGTVLRGIENPDDIGKFQINEYYHLAMARKLGYDIYTEEGNTRYALYLYSASGTSPWNWSKHCWGKYLTNK